MIPNEPSAATNSSPIQAGQVNHHPRRSFAGTVASLMSTADRVGAEPFRHPENGWREPLPGHPHLGHRVLSTRPSLLRSFEPPIAAAGLHTRGGLQGFVLPE